MAGFVTNIEKKSLENDCFREVLFTGPNSQLVVMSLKPGEDIGMETHDDVDQFIRVEAGEGKAMLNGKEHKSRRLRVVIPAGNQGAQHSEHLRDRAVETLHRLLSCRNTRTAPYTRTRLRHKSTKEKNTPDLRRHEKA